MSKGNRNRKNKKNIKIKRYVTSHRCGVKPSIPKTSEELREMNEIKSEEDLYKNIYFLDWTYEGQTIWDDEKCEPIPHGYGKEIFTTVKPIHDGIDGVEKDFSYEGGFKNGKRHGYGLLTLNIGTTYEGGFKNGFTHGKVFMSFKNSHNFIHSGCDLIEVRVEFLNNQIIGKIECVFEDGVSTILPADYLNDMGIYWNSWNKNMKRGFASFSEHFVS